MAIAKGKETVSEFKRYIGVGICKVIGFNPTKEQMKNLLGFEPKEEPVYTGTQESDGKQIPYTRLTFVLQTVPEKCDGIKLTQMLTLFVRNQYNRGSKSGKYQVIDEYGRTAWGDEATIKAKGMIMYANGPANVTQDYRPAYVGEEAVTNFLINLLNIPSPTSFDGTKWNMKPADELSNSLCRLDDIASYFTGKFDEIKEAILLQPNNSIKVLFGIQFTQDGKERQVVYPTVLRGNGNVEYLQKEVESRQANGGLEGHIYEFCPIKVYTVEPTEFNSDDDPIGSSEDLPWEK